MAAFRLDDLSTEAVRILAREVGVPVPQQGQPGADKEALIPQIVAQLGGNGSLALVPINPALDRPGRGKSVVRFLVGFVPLATVALTAWIAYANWQSAKTASEALHSEIAKEAKADKERRDYEWQKTVVYDIIDKGVRKDFSALNFQEIQNQYVAKAHGREEQLGKEKLQDEELLRILVDLMSLDVVYRTVDNQYYTKKSLLLKGDNSLTQNSTANAILRVLASERGTKTVDELRAIVTKDGTITGDDYHFVMAAMMGPSMGMVKILKNGKVYATPYPPPEAEK